MELPHADVLAVIAEVSHIVGLFLALVYAAFLFLVSTFLIETDENAS